MLLKSSVRNRIHKFLAPNSFSKIPVLPTCVEVTAYFSSYSGRKNPSYESGFSSKFREGGVERSYFDERGRDFGGIGERGFGEVSLGDSGCVRGGEKSNLDCFGEVSESEEEEDEGKYDEFRILESFARKRERGGVARRIEVEEDESRDPLVREACRLINVRASWSPELERELKRLVQRMRPNQVCAVIRAQSDERVALKFFDWGHRQWRYRHHPVVFHVMLRVLGKTKMCQGAKRILRLMERRKIELCSEDYCCVMVSYSRAGDWGKALQVLSFMQRAGLELDILICNTAMNVLVEGKKLEKALAFLERMQLVGVEPDVITYNSLIKGYCEGSRVEDAIKLIEEMPLKGCSPDKVSYYTVMGFLCKEGRIDELTGLMEKMLKDNNLLADQVTYNTIIHALSKHGHGKEALQFLREAEERGFHVDKVGRTAIVNCFCQEGKMEEAKAVIDDMFSKGCTPDVVTYTAVLSGFCRLGKIDQAKKLMNQMYKHGCKPNCVSYTALVNGLCQSGNTSEAREMVNMSEGLWTPNLVTYSVLMHGFRREGNFSEACDVIFEMTNKGIFPSPVEINTLINSLCRAGKTDLAKKLLEECLKKGCAVNVVNFTSVIHGFCRNDDLDTALSVLDDMYLNNKHPDEVTYTAVIDALGRKGRIDEAIVMTEKFIRSGYNPTPVTYRSLIQRFCQHGKVDELLILLDKLLQRQSFRMAYNLVIEKLCYFGKIDEAYKHLGRVLRTASKFDADTCHILMKGFLKNEDPIGSYRVACRMFNRNMIPDLKLCEEVSKRLISMKKFDEADKLILRFVERGHVSPKNEQFA